MVLLESANKELPVFFICITQTSQDEFHGTDESVPYEGYAQCRERIYAFRYATWFVD